jgi:peptidoglycan hydrolase CwlO-like protein
MDMVGRIDSSLLFYTLTLKILKYFEKQRTLEWQQRTLEWQQRTLEWQQRTLEWQQRTLEWQKAF